jgi:hypothetical protein
MPMPEMDMENMDPLLKAARTIAFMDCIGEATKMMCGKQMVMALEAKNNM